MAHPIQFIFDEMRKYPRIFRRSEKDTFLNWAEHFLNVCGYETKRQEKSGRLLKTKNLETSSTVQPEVIIMAHYDTPTIIPFWIEPLVRIFGHTRQLYLAAAIVVILLTFDFLPGTIIAIISWILYLSLLLLFVPNPRNFNDNSSGVIGLLYLAKQIGSNKAFKDKVKFVLVDNEELFLTGSDVLKDKWQAEKFPFQKAKIISLDCIGWGELPVIIRNGGSAELSEELLQIFQKERKDSQIIDMGWVPLNDNYVFREEGAVLLAYMNPTIVWKGGYYIKNIHSPLDVKTDLNKVKWMTDLVSHYVTQRR